MLQVSCPCVHTVVAIRGDYRTRMSGQLTADTHVALAGLEVVDGADVV